MNLWVKWKGDKAARKMGVQITSWVGFCGGRIAHSFSNYWEWGALAATPTCGTEKHPLSALGTLKAIVNKSGTKGALIIADRMNGVLGKRFFDAVPEKFETAKYECEARKLEFINRNHRSKVFSVLISTKTKPRKKKGA